MKRLFALLLTILPLALSGCGAATQSHGADFTVACTTYPVYLLANTIVGDIDGVEVTLVIDQQVSCLHDYSLTISDMKALEAADVVAVNGAGLEDFLGDVLEDRTVIDCSGGIELLESHEEHDDDECDPHIWMDPLRYAQMARNLAQALAERDAARSDGYLSRGEACAQELEAFYSDLSESEAGQAVSGCQIITFHDGFSYFANAFDLTIAAAIEEEEGAEASAKDLKETIAIVGEYTLPAVFTEVNGSANAADTIGRECGVRVAALSMVMSGQTGDTISAYESAIAQNIETIMEAYQ